MLKQYIARVFASSCLRQHKFVKKEGDECLLLLVVLSETQVLFVHLIKCIVYSGESNLKRAHIGSLEKTKG